MTYPEIRNAEYEVAIIDRVTGIPVPGCGFDDAKITGSFGRSLNGIATASITVERPTDCGDTLCDCQVTSRQHELAIWREGWSTAAFVGPILRTVDDPGLGSVRYDAADRSWWLHGAPHPTGRQWADEDVVSISGALLAEAERYSNSGLTFGFRGAPGALPGDSGTLITGSISEDGSIMEQIASYAGSLMEWTVVGPDFYWDAPGLEFPIGECLRNEHWRGPYRASNSQWVGSLPILDLDLSDAPTRVVVIGSGNARASWPPVEVDLGYGLRTKFIADTNVDSPEEALAVAKATYEDNKSPSAFVITGEGSLGPEFPVPFHELVPGRTFCVDVSGSCSRAESVLRLFNVVSEFETVIHCGRRALRETRVAIDLAPVGTTSSSERISA